MSANDVPLARIRAVLPEMADDLLTDLSNLDPGDLAALPDERAARLFQALGVALHIFHAEAVGQ